MLNFLVLENIHQDAILSLKDVGSVHRIEDPDEILAFAENNSVDCIITRGSGQVRKKLIDACHDLKLIARVGVGLDNIDQDHASAKGIKVVNAPGSTTLAVAEHSMLLMMALLRQLPLQTSEVKADNWNFRRGFVSAELTGKTLGILGLGAIGRRVADLASVFGMEVNYWSRTKKANYNYLEMADLLATSDVIFLGIALTTETKGFLDEEKIKAMKDGVYIVNTARGGVVVDQDLIDGLDSGKIAGYASDVLSQEPAPHGHPLVHHPKTLFTPHTAAITDETFKKMSSVTIKNVIGILTGADYNPDCVANREALG